MANLKLSMALSHYDRHISLFERIGYQAEGIDLTVLEVKFADPKAGRD